MNVLVHILTVIVLGRLERTSNRFTEKVWWRIPVYLLIFGSAAWVAVSSAFLWTSEAHPGTVGLLQFVRHGGPVWLLSIPLVALLIVLVVSIPAAGRYGIVCVLQAASFALTLIGLATFQADGHATLNGAVVSSFLVTMPATLLALVTALADTPSVDAPLAFATRSYFGRLGHLRALLATARRLVWEIEMPQRPSLALTVAGYYGGGRSVRVVSGATYTNYGPKGESPGYWYTVTLTSSRPLPGFRISHLKTPPEFAAHAVTGTVRGSLKFYVIPQYGRPISETWKARFTQQIASGKGYMRWRPTRIEIVPGGLFYSYFDPFRLSAKSGNVEPLIEWLSGIASLLEEISPQVEEVAPASTDTVAARLPYGQISQVDPTRHA